MSTRDQLNNAIYNGLRKNHQKLMSSVAINTGAVADHLIALGWRPPVRGAMNLDEYIRQSETDSNLSGRLDSGEVQNLLDEAIELIEALRAIVDSHPNPLECGKHDDDDPVSCGWKIAYTQIVQQIGGGEAA